MPGGAGRGAGGQRPGSGGGDGGGLDVAGAVSAPLLRVCISWECIAGPGFIYVRFLRQHIGPE